MHSYTDLGSQGSQLFDMGNPGDGVLLDEEDPDVAGLGRVQVQRGHHVLQQALQPFPLSPVRTVDTFFYAEGIRIRIRIRFSAWIRNRIRILVTKFF